MLLVTGATGNVGRELARELDAAGAPFRVLVRDPARAAGLPAGAERVRGDLDHPATLVPAFAGADGLFLLTPGIGTDHVRHAVAAAQAAGVRHIVHLSSSNVLGDPMPAMGRWHHEREQVIRACGIPATFLRPGGFMTNAFDWLPTIRDDGYVLNPAGLGRYATIDPADIAAVAAVALTGTATRAGSTSSPETRRSPSPSRSPSFPRRPASISRCASLPPPTRPSAPAFPTGRRRRSPTPSSRDSPCCAQAQPASHRYRPEAARPRAPHLRRLVRTQRRRLPPGCRRLSPQVRRVTGRPANASLSS